MCLQPSGEGQIYTLSIQPLGDRNHSSTVVEIKEKAPKTGASSEKVVATEKTPVPAISFCSWSNLEHFLHLFRGGLCKKGENGSTDEEGGTDGVGH